jgi:hypothetical protein
MDTGDASGGGQDGGSRKRMADFLNHCSVVKKRKVDIELVVSRKRLELKRLAEQVKKLQAAMDVLAQKLSLKESLVDSVGREVVTLQAEWREASE